MKYALITVLLCFGINMLSAQEVYNSSGRPGHKKHKESGIKGYDPSKLVFGGGAVAGFGSGYANFGISPIVGYRFRENFAAGVGLGYEYLKFSQFMYNPMISDYQSYATQAHIISPSVWTRVGIINNVFAEGIFEYNIMAISDYGYDDNYTTVVPEKLTVGVPSLLLGGGIKQPAGDRVSVIFEILYDVLQQDRSPYWGVPVFRGGIVVGL